MIFFAFTCACLIVCACAICAQVSEEARRWCRISWSWSYIHTVLSHPTWISAAEPGSSTREQALLRTEPSFQFPTFLLYIPTSCQLVIPGVPSNFVSVPLILFLISCFSIYPESVITLYELPYFIIVGLCVRVVCDMYMKACLCMCRETSGWCWVSPPVGLYLLSLVSHLNPSLNNLASLAAKLSPGISTSQVDTEDPNCSLMLV